MNKPATCSHGIGAPGYSETWPCEPQSAGRARALVGTALSVWGLKCLADRATLVVSELVTNSVLHTRCRLVRVGIVRPDKELVCITVSDRSTVRPAIRTPDEEWEAGRGLMLVEAMADRWEVDVRRWGKIVRVDLRVTAEG
ncbi:hypothetical protein SRB5_68120 [Streptomyces sp. RB5]|uniref:Histidine kinase/HSP90-like ATPase domain-containing protein n=1 Tax=Streptomyces smaragdinus TaxID=2585196 RepID=A0A7K0CT37_9ACTN|nr:ATP-binding protein [Streptomyces smaragdinus]MQY16610.1 hypothetical protein [Streptomyces smaragdinus]